MFNKKCGEIISFMPIFFVKQSLLFFNSITGAEKFGKIYLKKQSP